MHTVIRYSVITAFGAAMLLAAPRHAYAQG
jgi:hypothetical protein